VVKLVGERPQFDFEPRDHLELASGWIDVDRAARTSGSRFAYLLGDVALLWQSIQRLAIAHLSQNGFMLVMPPVMVREDAMYGTGFFPTDRQSIYRLADDELYLVGTSEVPLAAFHQREILSEAELPVRYVGLSACFRREAGAAGRDTRGIFRTHQFEKVEMFSFCHPDRSWDEHELMLRLEEEIAQTLGLHYRVVNIAAGDLGASAAKKYDIEVWLPGQQRYRELTSCSNCTDYQARRLQTRYRPEDGSPRVLHTLNGTAVTSSRTVIAVLETHQQADGTVAVPEALQRHGAPAVIAPRR
jgi:seryl-tRNA synthetase